MEILMSIVNSHSPRRGEEGIEFIPAGFLYPILRKRNKKYPEFPGYFSQM
jgi:hypothetical protein